MNLDILKRLIKIIIFPVQTLFSNRTGFAIIYKKKLSRNAQWFMYTRGVVIPINVPNIDALEYFRHFVPAKSENVFDVGGELGLETRQFSKIVGERGRVFTFECMPQHVSKLNDLSNTLKNVTVVEAACWNDATKLTFYEGHTAGSGSAVTDARGQRGQELANPSTDGFEVEANTLDYFWENLAHSKVIDFLKMDIEGAEYEALEGAQKLLKFTRKVVIAAYHMRGGVRTAHRVSQMLKSSGFEVKIDENFHVYGVRSNLDYNL